MVSEHHCLWPGMSLCIMKGGMTRDSCLSHDSQEAEKVRASEEGAGEKIHCSGLYP